MALEEYRKKIANLSVNEQKLRDLYLRDLALGKIQGPPTGYASLDKPWLKYYREEAIIDDISNNSMTAYQMLLDKNKDFPNYIALEYFGKKIKNSEMFKKIDQTANAFSKYGIMEGDFVTICAAGIPETVYSFYALSKIGAVANMISPWFDHNQLVERIEDCKSDMLIIMDKFYPLLKDAIDKSRINKVIIIPTLNSSAISFLQKKPKLKSNNEIYWNDFFREGKYISNVESVNYKKNQPVVMVYSSGTTGASKGILLTNDSLQSTINAYNHTEIDLSPGHKFYQIIPPWFSTGLSTSIHLPLTSTATVFMDPRFEREVFVKNIIKAKPNYSIAPTSMYEGFLDSKELKNKDLSFFTYPFEGGEPLPLEVRLAIENVFKKHGNNSKLCVGYGQCECGATVTTEVHGVEHPDGTVGVPLPGIELRIVDDNFDEVLYKERGQVLVCTPSSMLEYYNNPNSTNSYFYIDNEGKKWNCTGDVGYIDEDGNLFIEGRASDYSLVNGNKVYNFDVEKVVKTCSDIKIVDVVERKNISCENAMAVHIIFNDNFKSQMNVDSDLIESKIEEIQTAIYDVLGDVSMVPTFFKVRDSFPYAKSGKRDTKALSLEKDGYIFKSFSKKDIKTMKKECK